MLWRGSKYHPLLHRFITCASSINTNNRLLFSTSMRKKEEEDRFEQETAVNPQADFADIWETTTDDKIQHLTQEIRRSSGKKIAIFGSMSALLCGKMGWYQFEFLGMPFEMEVVMLHLPFTFITIHWLSWYFNMSKIYKKLVFKLPPDWKANEGLIGGTKSEYHQLVVMDNKSNLVLLDEWSKHMNKHKIVCAAMCAMNISIVMLTGSINPFSDPALTALQPVSIVAYSFYPLVAYAFSLVIYASPMKNIPYWKEEIVQELHIDNQDQDQDEGDNE